MVSSVALISDLHGNLFALDAVIADANARGVERIICLGDVATLGPLPREVIARLQELGCPCILGNHDAFMLDKALINSYTEVPIVVDAVEWCRLRLQPADLEFLRGFARTMVQELADGFQMFLYHGSPRSHMKELLADTPAAVLDAELFEGQAPSVGSGLVSLAELSKRTDVYAGGHTHVSMVRQHRGKWVVNPGSVGQPFRESVSLGAPTVLPFAEYGIVAVDSGQLSVTLHRVPLDRAALREQIRCALDHPLATSFLDAYAD
jgi:predicted phosphodiesterase